ncbi:parasite-infected erythrocyte surface protein [Plasmodium relictum]|uniref:N-acetylgalactosaminide beta-1,3-galactosyltransferase n=1 Tax=Plasmodium relictum TaxID=85471 RepID=A0A1J1H559_PLARL|nr:parasite-infected erythrocyte surface protein [Plasmodium relictum]CRG99825.1 parasite-infected erythrocyte surface protein [Plasmodium relictum]
MIMSKILIFFILNVLIKCSNVKERLFLNIKKRTKFLLLNEPIVHLSFSENLIHSLVFDLENDKNLYTLDETLLNLKNLNHSSIFRLLVDTYKKIEEDKDDRENIRYIFLGTSFSRIHPLNLEYFLRKLDKYVYNESIYKKGNINIREIINEYNNEIKIKLEEKEKIKKQKEKEKEKEGEQIDISEIEKIITNEKHFFLNNDDRGNDKYVIKDSIYNGLFIGYGLNDESPSIIHHYNLDSKFYFPYFNSGILMDITLLRNIYNKSITSNIFRTINIDYIYEVSLFLNEKLNVKLTTFENTCINDEKNIYLLDNDLNNFELYKYYQVLHLFKDLNLETQKDNNRNDQNSEMINDKENNTEKNFKEKYEDDELAELILSYFNIFYPISTCISYSIRTKSESLLGYDKFHIMNIENNIKLKNYIKETENIEFSDIDEYKMKLNRINNKYNFLLDENENTLTYKNILIGVKTSINTEERIPYIKNTYDNKENTKRIFNNFTYETKLKENSSGMFSSDFLNNAIESEHINIDVIYMSDKESSKYDNLYMNTKITSKDGLCEKLKHMIFYFYEEYIKKNSEKKYFFIADDDTFVNVKNLIDVMNLTLNECVHSKKYMYNKYLKSYKFLEENESFFLRNFKNKSLFLYEYLKNNFLEAANSLKKYDYVPKYCKNKSGINNSTIPIYVGQRYSYNSFSEKNYYDYLTGGAGMLINEETARRIYLCENCICTTDNSFIDDMILGKWARNLDILAINFEGFFQNHPNEYNKKYLDNIVPITYHKLNKDKTVEQTKKIYFDKLVYYNKNNYSTKDSHIDYLDRNYTNMIDSIFHYFYYINMYDTEPNNIIKMNSKIYSKMHESKNYKYLFDLKKFFKNQIGDHINLQRDGNHKHKKKIKKRYSNNYIDKRNSDLSDLEGGKNENESKNSYENKEYLNEYEDDELLRSYKDDEDENDEDEDENDEDEDEDDYDDYDEYLEEIASNKSNNKHKSEKNEHLMKKYSINNDSELTNNPKESRIINEKNFEVNQYEDNYDEL